MSDFVTRFSRLILEPVASSTDLHVLNWLNVTLMFVLDMKAAIPHLSRLIGGS